MTKKTRLAERVVMVTGGGSGIGKGACERIAAEGGKVGVLDIRLPLAKAVADEINASGGSALAIQCDVAKEEDVAHAIATLVNEYGSLYGMVANAGAAGSVIGAGGAAASYAVSKAGVFQLAKQIAVDYGNRGIRANAIQPGAVAESNLGKHVSEDRETHETPIAELPRPKPWMLVRRAGYIYEEYGATIAFLLSDDSGYITGTSIPVDGGYLAT